MSPKKVRCGCVGLLKAIIGIDAAPADVVQARREACRGCDQATRNPRRMDGPSKGLWMASACRACGCSIAAKTLIAREKCPLGKWTRSKPGDTRLSPEKTGEK